MVQVRRVQPKDLDYIYNNSESLGYNQEAMSNKLESMMLVVDNNIICGIGFYMNIEDKCILNWIHIEKEHRRNRLGTMLIKTMLNISEQQGTRYAYISCDCDVFAEFLGFQKIIDAEEKNSINKIVHDLYQSKASDNIYKVSLADYFKPCCSKHNAGNINF